MERFLLRVSLEEFIGNDLIRSAVCALCCGETGVCAQRIEFRIHFQVNIFTRAVGFGFAQPHQGFVVLAQSHIDRRDAVRRDVTCFRLCQQTLQRAASVFLAPGDCVDSTEFGNDADIVPG